eukprot:CAMPEP_0114274126 /NCGR_PEP_ID=MMETSP0058-20121206/29555_1 /TAXON_ID=36894 /ORGANISM="Pyramimonas parkeae, CCMP726" /LENGTH=105 /DNA_ID=CAMNT_0001393809 /DNA_START=116 /DNA_END=433 /DNA_ORIENTATION=+
MGWVDAPPGPIRYGHLARNGNGGVLNAARNLLGDGVHVSEGSFRDRRIGPAPASPRRRSLNSVLNQRVCSYPPVSFGRDAVWLRNWQVAFLIPTALGFNMPMVLS